MTPREIAKDVLSTLMDWFSVHMEAENQKIFLDYLERKILADRQALQSEIDDELMNERGKRLMEGIGSSSVNTQSYQLGISQARSIVQSVFAQQSQPEESKPEFDPLLPECQPKTCSIAQAESDRRVLVEREACAEIADNFYQVSVDQNERCEYAGMISRDIRARSNAEQGSKPKYGPGAHLISDLPTYTPFDPSCSTCVREAREEAEEDAKIKAVPIVTHESVEAVNAHIQKVNDWQAERIVLLTQLIGEQQIKITRLEKEKHEYLERITRDHINRCACDYCDELRACPNNRKA